MILCVRKFTDMLNTIHRNVSKGLSNQLSRPDDLVIRTRIPQWLQRQWSCWVLVPMGTKLSTAASIQWQRTWMEQRTNTAINSTCFKQFRNINDSVFEVQLVKAQIEHREHIIAGVFILPYAKIRMLELYYKSTSSESTAMKRRSKNKKWTQTRCI